MNHFFKIYKRVAHLNEIKGGFYNILPQRDLRFAAKIKWVRPERKPVYHPSSSGDLSAVKLPPIDTLRPPFQNSEELKKLDLWFY